MICFTFILSLRVIGLPAPCPTLSVITGEIKEVLVFCLFFHYCKINLFEEKLFYSGERQVEIPDSACKRIQLHAAQFLVRFYS